jgi:hypothetical protein
MGQVLHGSATTTEAVRRAIQSSQESVRALPTPTARELTPVTKKCINSSIISIACLASLFVRISREPPLSRIEWAEKRIARQEADRGRYDKGKATGIVSPRSGAVPFLPSFSTRP